jgi:alkyl hydroperoxide reductase subunit AhpC
LNDINVGRYVDENISIVKELKLKDVNGEVWKEKWRNGSKKLKNDNYERIE